MLALDTRINGFGIKTLEYFKQSCYVEIFENNAFHNNDLNYEDFDLHILFKEYIF